LSKVAGQRYNPSIGKLARHLILTLLAAASIATALIFRLPLAAIPAVLCLFIGFLLGRAPRGGVPTDARRLLDGISLGIIIHSAGRIVFANERMHVLLGAAPGGLEGIQLDSLAQPDEAAVLRSLQDPDLPREIPLLRRDGTTFWVQAEACRIMLHGQSFSQLNLIDVTSRRVAEEGRRELAELVRRQEEQLEHSTRLAELGEMAASISHELNQPLTGIRNYARNAYYMLEQKPGAEADVKNNLRLISEQVDRAAKIINQMRELTKRTDSAFSLLDLNSVIRESVEFILPQMRLSEVEVSLHLEDSLPPVWGDRIRLEQVFLNLLSNARQSMTDMPVRTLVIESRGVQSAALPVVVEVRDTGKGFSETQAGQLFQPFFTTRKGGHGLGLSISRAIVQDHKGTIDARGSPGAGATFTVRLPAAMREGGPARSDM
jgi:PAS domain S-box-containing protein